MGYYRLVLKVWWLEAQSCTRNLKSIVEKKEQQTLDEFLMLDLWRDYNVSVIEQGFVSSS